MADEPDGDTPEQWLDAHGDALYAFAMMRVNDRAAAEDLVQETLLAALTAAASYQARSSMRTWLVGILKNKVIDYLRRSARETALDPELLDDDEFSQHFGRDGHWLSPPADWGDPARVAENEALGQALMTCIGRLPEKLRMPLVLREIDGLDSSEVIGLLGISSANNLWVMLSRARERVRACLEAGWFAGGGR